MIAIEDEKRFSSKPTHEWDSSLILWCSMRKHQNEKITKVVCRKQAQENQKKKIGNLARRKTWSKVHVILMLVAISLAHRWLLSNFLLIFTYHDRICNDFYLQQFYIDTYLHFALYWYLSTIFNSYLPKLIWPTSTDTYLKANYVLTLVCNDFIMKFIYHVVIPTYLHWSGHFLLILI